jgi:hypothetical protein
MDVLSRLSVKPTPKKEPPVVRVSTVKPAPIIGDVDRAEVGVVAAAEAAAAVAVPPVVVSAPVSIRLAIPEKSGATEASYKEMIKTLQSRGIPVGIPSKMVGIDERVRMMTAKPLPKLTEDKELPATISVPGETAESAAKPTTKRITTTGKLVRKTAAPAPLISAEDAKFTPEIIKSVFGSVAPARRLTSSVIPPIRVPSYYLNNHRRFISAMSSLFAPYRAEIKAEEAAAVSCEGRRSEPGAEFSLLTHQKIVRDYIQVFTPYRGVLLYHGLGSGKTCTSIAIAESFKDNKKIIVMTPASLQESYRQELRKCGDILYRQNQYWEFLSVSKTDKEGIAALASVTGLTPEYVRAKGGAWMVDRTKKPRKLDNKERVEIDAQIDRMIDTKYKFINYNGITRKSWKKMTTEEDETGAGAAAAAADEAVATPAKRINPFDDAVVIVDEAHNLMSRIVNKLGRKTAVASEIYEFMLSAHNSRFVFLSGTPIINYPNEMAIMFNILRGYITTWKMTVRVETDRRIDEDAMRDILKGLGETDYISYKPSSNNISNKLEITRNPFGFSNVMSREGNYTGVAENERARITDEMFIGAVTSRLRTNGINIVDKATLARYKALPDTLDAFADRFLKSDGKGEILNPNLLRRRLLGLTSYFRSAQEQLLPRYNPAENQHIVEIEMSDYQLGVHEEERQKERDQEKRKKRPTGTNQAADLYKDTTSTYRIFSRAACNFVFPPEVPRPKVKKEAAKTAGRASEKVDEEVDEEVDEDVLDNASLKEREENPDARVDDDDAETVRDELESSAAKTYAEQLQRALMRLDRDADKYLSPEGLATYSPKFLAILENLRSETNRGLNLIYSQFRTLEGIGVLALVLKHNGFAQLKVKNVDGKWSLDMKEEDRVAGKPRFALYTGTETSDEREIIRKIFNGEWGPLPDGLREELLAMNADNRYGEVVKVLMITSSGAEGINLRNVRYVHIVEPYWHPSRIEQVIGRARRICSHEDLPEADRTVDVYMYRMIYPKKISDERDKYLSLLTNEGDKGKLSGKISTSDGILYEISEVKNMTNQGLLKAVKETSIDCAIYVPSGGAGGDDGGLVCFTFGTTLPEQYDYATTPDITEEENDAVETAIAARTEQRARAAADIIRQPLRRKPGAGATAAAASSVAPPTVKKVENIINAINFRGAEYAVNLDTGDAYVLESYKRVPPVYELLEDISTIMKSDKFLPKLHQMAAKIRRERTK